MNATTDFDGYAQSYDDTLNAGLKVSGEDSAFFAARRIEETAKAITELGLCPSRERAIDFGCGTGNSSQQLKEALGFEKIFGLDVSPASLAVARERFDDSALNFQTIESHTPAQNTDLIFCNGVFHHIPSVQREASLSYIRATLKPGGVFVFWENNPWNPGVHYVMRSIPFDHDAEKILPHTAVRLLRGAGFRTVRLRFFFVFPKALARLRVLEPALARLPLGAQYQIVATKDRP
jgi:trans-aconitate methyltransferase